MLLVGLFVPAPRRMASQQTHEFDETWIGSVAALWCKRQLRFVAPGDVFAILNANVFHRNAIDRRSHRDNPEHHQLYDRQQ